MTKKLHQLNLELYEIFSGQYLEYLSWYENKKYFLFDYLETSCSYIIYSIEHCLEKNIETELLLAQFESLLALVKAEMQKDTWQNTDFSLKSPQRFSKSAYKNNKKKYIS